MEHMKTVKIPEHEEEVVDSKTCDICGAVIKEDSAYEINSVEVECRTGQHFYPDGGEGEITKVDMCKACFMGKLVPWLQSIGVKVKTEAWSW